MVNTYDFHFRRRYNLPPTDPRYLDATPDEIAADYWAHWYQEHPGAQEEAHDPDFDIDELVRKSEAGEWEEI
jgi:hypothetical protein